MNQESSVKMMIRQIKLDNQIPDEYIGFVRGYLKFSFVMGWDERGKNLAGHNLRKVVKYRKDEPEQKYNSVKEARVKNKYSQKIIQKALRTGEPTYKGDIFKYENELKNVG